MKNKFIYNITVEDRNLTATYEIKANSSKEAKEKAKRKFIKDIYDPSHIKCYLTSKENNG